MQFLINQLSDTVICVRCFPEQRRVQHALCGSPAAKGGGGLPILAQPDNLIAENTQPAGGLSGTGVQHLGQGHGFIVGGYVLQGILSKPVVGRVEMIRWLEGVVEQLDGETKRSL